jgi:hypothetical protein
VSSDDIVLGNVKGRGVGAVSGRTYTVKVYRYDRSAWFAKAQSPTDAYWWTSANGRTRRQAIRRIKRKLRQHEREMAWRANQEQIEVTL